MIIMQQLIVIIMEDSKILFCVSKFPWARGRISSKFRLFYISFTRPASLYREEYIYIYIYIYIHTHTHTSACVQTVYELP